MPRWLAPLALGPLLLLGACGSGESPPARDAGAVDTVLPPAEALARFRTGLPEVTALEGGAASREDLVKEFVTAVVARDTATLTRLHLSRAEFGWLYYPTSIQGSEPTYLPPDLAWFLSTGRTDRDLPKLLERLESRTVAYRRHDCPTQRAEGANQVYGHCLTRLAIDGSEESQQIFGLIVERDGRWKFVNYANRME